LLYSIKIPPAISLSLFDTSERVQNQRQETTKKERISRQTSFADHASQVLILEHFALLDLYKNIHISFQVRDYPRTQNLQ